MKKELIFDLKSPYRNNFQIYAFRFGNGRPSAAIVGAMRGDEAQQQFICSQVVKNLIGIEQRGLIREGHEILVIPSANHFSMNINTRFWAMDNTDGNRMFPGYDKGETTQRIAAALFEAVKGYQFGIQLASFYLHGDFIPHVRVLDTGYQDMEAAKTFGMPYVLLRDPVSFDTTLLNYNWQIFGTQAYSVYSGYTDAVNKRSAKLSWKAILRFLHKNKIITYHIHDGYNPAIVNEKDLYSVTSTRGGILYQRRWAGDDVKRGDLIAKILDPYDGSTLSEITAPVSGELFFSHQKPLVSQNTLIYRIAEYS
ncbi:MAG: succinylglutamate desuccinylase/aspartoacylase family protein [Treponema sp.]|jgi:predicted deacylase|nr:succinylglutamate desuccinylase/aspartoacylase family protein [Treponema sp.]